MHILYDPELSTRGVKMCVTRAPRARDPAEMIEHMCAFSPQCGNSLIFAR